MVEVKGLPESLAKTLKTSLPLYFKVRGLDSFHTWLVDALWRGKNHFVFGECQGDLVSTGVKSKKLVKTIFQGRKEAWIVFFFILGLLMHHGERKKPFVYGYDRGQKVIFNRLRLNFDKPS